MTAVALIIRFEPLFVFCATSLSYEGEWTSSGRV